MGLRRVFITSDIGGHDPDDQQSFAHMLHYYDEFELCGFSVGVPDGKRRVPIEMVALAEEDGHTYPGIRGKIHEGAPRAGLGQGAAGIDALISAAESGDGWLYVLCWGAPTDLACALKKKPIIARKIRAFVLGDWNVAKDKEAYKHICGVQALQWVSCMSTFRGMYLGAPEGGKYSNAGFLSNVVRHSGALGRYVYRISEGINTGAHSIKMGDTPSLLWALKSSETDIGLGGWGGRYKRIPGKQLWVDAPGARFKLGNYFGARSVAMHRKEILDDWERKILQYKAGK